MKNKQGMMPLEFSIALVLLLAFSHARGQTFFEEIRFNPSAITTLATDSNLTRAQDTKNIISDRFARIDLAVNSIFELSFNKAIIIEPSFSYQAYQFTPSLNRSEFSASVIYRWQNSFSYNSPWYQLMGKTQHWLTGVKQRRSYVNTAHAMSSARLTTVITWMAGLEWSQRLSEGSVFDTEQSRLFLNIDYTVNNQIFLYAGYNYIAGDTLSSVQSSYCNGLASTSIYPLIVASEEIEWDQAFSEDHCGNWLTYRLNATTQTATLGLNYGLNHSTSLDASILSVQVNAEDGIEYSRQIFQFSLLKGF
jgi:hypothetical protein